MDFNPLAVLVLCVGLLGLVAGTLGGLLGVGGSVIIIPGLVGLFAVLSPGADAGQQHVFQAAAMVANVAVAVPAMLRHRRAGMIDPPAVHAMVPAAAIGIVGGVMLSNLPLFSGPGGGRLLGKILAGFLVWVVVVNLWKLRPHSAAAEAAEPGRQHAAARQTPRFAAVGAVMGTCAGLLGIGGGALAVPLQQQLIGRPLRRCIANSATAMCVSTPIGAALKNLSLGSHVPPGATGLSGPGAGLILGLLLAPTAWAGSRLGARLTHSLPLRLIRAGFVLIMAAAAWKMATR